MDRESPELIEQEMQQTRESLAAKVSALETQVMGTLTDAQAAVNTTVNAVTSTVESVKTTVEETLSSVREGVSESVADVTDNLKSALDVSRHTRENPWAMVGGATAVGLLTGLLVFRSSRPSFGRLQQAAAAPPSYPQAPPPAAPSRPTWIDGLMERAGRELQAIGEAAIASAAAALKQTVQEGVPQLINTETIASAVGVRAEPAGRGPSGFDRPM